MKKFMAGAIGAVLMTLPSAAFAECVINNTQADAELQKVEGIYGSDLGAVRRDMRQLRASAYILKRYGQDEACQRVVETISQVLRDPKAAAAAARTANAGTDTSIDTGATGTAGTAAGTSTTETTGTVGTGTASTEQTGSTNPAVMSMNDRRTAAVPLPQSQRSTSIGDLIGSDVYGPNNDSVGEVEDVIMGQGQQQPGYAVISFGGFLGLGAEQVAIPLSAIRISEDNYLFVDFDRNRLESAPKIRRGSTKWLSDSEWRRQNDAYYTGNQ